MNNNPVAAGQAPVGLATRGCCSLPGLSDALKEGGYHLIPLHVMLLLFEEYGVLVKGRVDLGHTCAPALPDCRPCSGLAMPAYDLNHRDL